MSGKQKLVINFHGIGTPWDGVPAEEVRYWCPRPQWPALADELARQRDRDGGLEITFDDGNPSDVLDALPTLLDRGLRATFFVCAGRIGQPRYMDAAHLQELVAAGMGIGCHGWSHVDLRRVEDAGLRREVSDARDQIRQAAGAPVDEFALPFGSYDRRVLQSLRAYRRVLSSDGGGTSPGDWLVPRTSYVRGWEPKQIIDLAGTSQTLTGRIRKTLATTLKSIR